MVNFGPGKLRSSAEEKKTIVTIIKVLILDSSFLCFKQISSTHLFCFLSSLYPFSQNEGMQFSLQYPLSLHS